MTFWQWYNTSVKPKILIFDIEVSPNISYTWETYETNVIEFVHEWQLLTIAYQWLDSNKVHVIGNCDYTSGTDKEIVEKLWQLFDEADIIIGHNINSFDIKKANARFIHYGLNSPSHYRTVDTMRVYKRYFKDNRNGLDYIAQKHKLGKKLGHTGFEMWKGCMAGDKKAWDLMKKYNKQDVVVTTALYKFLLPWIDNHPNVATILHTNGCPNCGSENFRSDGIRYANGAQYRRLQCLNCGARSKGSVKGKITSK